MEDTILITEEDTHIIQIMVAELGVIIILMEILVMDTDTIIMHITDTVMVTIMDIIMGIILPW